MDLACINLYRQSFWGQWQNVCSPQLKTFYRAETLTLTPVAAKEDLISSSFPKGRFMARHVSPFYFWLS